MSWQTADRIVTPILLWLGVVGVCLLYRYRTANRRPLTIQGAALAVGVAWLIAYGTATGRAIVYLVAPFLPRMVSSGRALLHAIAVDYLPMSVFAVLAVTVAARRVGLTATAAGFRSPVRTQRDRREFAAPLVLCLAVMHASAAIAAVLLHAARSPWGQRLISGAQPWYDVDAVCSAAAAAVGEELLVVVLPVLLLRAAGVSSTRIILVALALRLSYHLYYGWQSPYVLGWGAGFVVLYLWRGWIWPQLIAHFVFDVINGVRLPEWLYQLAWAAAFLIPIGYLVAVRWRLRRSPLLGFAAWQRNGGEAALRADLVGATNGAFPVVVSARRALPRLAVTRGRKDGSYQVKVGPGIQQLSTGEREALVAREAAVIRLGHAAYDATRARRERRRTASAATVLVAGVALSGVVAVRFHAQTGAWLVLLIYLATLAALYRAAAAEAARSWDGTSAADRAAVQSVGAPSVRDLVARIQAMEEPVVGWISGRGVSSRVTAADRLALITNS